MRSTSLEKEIPMKIFLSFLTSEINFNVTKLVILNYLNIGFIITNVIQRVIQHAKSKYFMIG